MTNNPAKYFDQILYFLSTDYNRMFTFDDVLNELYKSNLKGKSKLDRFFGAEIKPEENNDFLNAIMFLYKEGLIWYDITTTSICIQTAGFIKIKTSGFEKDIKNAKYTMWFSWFNNVFTPLIALVALILSLYVLFSRSNINSNTNKDDTYQQENTK